MNRLRTSGFTRNVLPAVVYLVALFIGGSWPQGPEIEPVFLFQDKFLHLFAFGGLQVLVWRALCHLAPGARRVRVLGLSLVLSCLAGGLLELWQGLLPSREADAYDWLADVAGAAIAAVGLRRSRAAGQESPRAVRAATGEQ
ncbi:MAG TPA: VanZ family protein [Polyangiaceae bacterium]|nr:VanZ family protein [Polyangiaceae bacterium]